jgi:hypothetical protein
MVKLLGTPGDFLKDRDARRREVKEYFQVPARDQGAEEAPRVEGLGSSVLMRKVEGQEAKGWLVHSFKCRIKEVTFTPISPQHMLEARRTRSTQTFRT